MINSRLDRRLAAAFVAIASLAGCGGSVAPPLINAGASGPAAWMKPGVEKSALLYVSDIGAETVDVFTYPALKPVGTLSGFDEPNGLCVDAKGDVFVTNSYADDILEYAHGGTKPIATLQDPSGFRPNGCAIDPTTGNLAVTNIGGPSTLGQGGVEIYKHARGTPTTYQSSLIFFAYYCGYDNAGNLFADTFSQYGGPPDLAELVKGGSQFVQIGLGNLKFGWPGGVQWDGNYLSLGDQFANKFVQEPYNNVIYQLSVSKQIATLVATDDLKGGGDVVQYWIDGKDVLGPDAQNDEIASWRYPAGAKRSELLNRFYEPVGVVVSRIR